MQAESHMIGWLAAAAMLATFACRSMVGIRLFGIVANLAFIAYGIEAGLMPVLLLHAVLLPINAVHLNRALRDRLRRSYPGNADVRDRRALSHFGTPLAVSGLERCCSMLPDSWVTQSMTSQTRRTRRTLTGCSNVTGGTSGLVQSGSAGTSAPAANRGA